MRLQNKSWTIKAGPKSRPSVLTFYDLKSIKHEEHSSWGRQFMFGPIRQKFYNNLSAYYSLVGLKEL